MSLTGISDKVVLLSGASGSLGRATAGEFARLGARLVLTGRDPAKLGHTAVTCQQNGASLDRLITVTGDVTCEDDVREILAQTIKTFGQIDILVNCAGMIKSGEFLETKMADYDAIFKTNTRGTFLMCKHAVPYIIETKGCVVNLSSLASIRPCFSYCAYSMAGAALDHFTRALALELGPKGVRVNSVNPGVTRDTELWTREGAPYESKTDEVAQLQADLTKLYPLRRLCETSDVAHAIAFLCSQNASFIHGAILPIDGAKVLTAKPSA